MSFKKFVEKYFDNPCKSCGNIRKEITFDSLPIEVKKVFKTFITGGEDFYYCGVCQEYSGAKDMHK